MKEKTEKEIIQRGVELFPELSYDEVKSKLEEHKKSVTKKEDTPRRKSLLGRSLED